MFKTVCRFGIFYSVMKAIMFDSL